MTQKTKIKIVILLLITLSIISITKAAEEGCCINPRSPQYCWIDPDWTGDNELKLTPFNGCCPYPLYNPSYYGTPGPEDYSDCADRFFVGGENTRDKKSCWAYNNNPLGEENDEGNIVYPLPSVEPVATGEIDECNPNNIGCCCGCDAEGNRLVKENLYREKCGVLGDYSFVGKEEEEICTEVCNEAPACPQPDEEPIQLITPETPGEEGEEEGVEVEDGEEPTTKANGLSCKDGFDCQSQHCAFKPDGTGTCQESRANPKCKSMNNANVNINSHTCFNNGRRTCYYVQQGRLATWRINNCPSGQNCANGRCIAGPSVTVTTQTCTDGTLPNSCSTTKPKYCRSGVLIDNCQRCSCSEGGYCNTGGSCTRVTTTQQVTLPACNNNQLCEEDESCSCSDCEGQQNGCGEGLICSDAICVPRPHVQPAPEAICIDFDRNEAVDISDFLLFKAESGKDTSSPNLDIRFDLGGPFDGPPDGEIGLPDLFIFAENYQNPDSDCYRSPQILEVPLLQDLMPCHADFNGNGIVYFPDFLLFKDEFGKDSSNPNFDQRFDLGGPDEEPDGEIGFVDLLIFADSFNKRCNRGLTRPCLPLFDAHENALLADDENIMIAIQGDIIECCRENPDEERCIGLDMR